jgi:hypothetical protein
MATSAPSWARILFTLDVVVHHFFKPPQIMVIPAKLFCRMHAIQEKAGSTPLATGANFTIAFASLFPNLLFANGFDVPLPKPEF